MRWGSASSGDDIPSGEIQELTVGMGMDFCEDTDGKTSDSVGGDLNNLHALMYIPAIIEHNEAIISE